MFGYFLSISQQGVSADSIQNPAVVNFSPKTEGTKTKAARSATTQIWKLKNLMSLFSDVFSLHVHFEFFAIFSYCLVLTFCQVRLCLSIGIGISISISK
jgi:hypothetical protein